MLQLGSDESPPNWSVREQLLLAQAVHQVQSNGSEEKTIDWTRVIELLEQFLKSKKLDGLEFSFKDHQVCSHVYAKLCQTYLQDQNQPSIDDSQSLTITRQLYQIFIKSLVEALQEEEKKCRKIQGEIEAIARGEWDEKLKAAYAQSDQQLQIVSEKPLLESQPDLSNSESLGTLEEKNPSNLPPSLPPSLSGSSPSGTTIRKSPNLEVRSATIITKEVHQEESSNSQIPSTNGNDSSNLVKATRGRKRKALSVNVPDKSKKAEKAPTEESKKQSIQSPTSRSRAPKVPKSSDSDSEDDDDATVEKLVKAVDTASPSMIKNSHRYRETQKVECELSNPSDSKMDSSHLNQPQLKRARIQAKEDVSSRGDLEISGKSPAHANSPSHKEKEIPEKSEQGYEAANSRSSNKPTVVDESPIDGSFGGRKLTEESHSTSHSPSSNKKSAFEHEISADGSLVGTPNSASFAISVTDGSLTTNQTPNSAKLGLFPITDANTTRVAGSSSISNNGTTNDPTSFRRRMLKTHSSVQSNPISSIFRDPVKESEAPGYYLIVKRPMDLRTLAKKLRDGKVVSTEEYRRDLMLMLANAVMFNHEDSDVTRHAKELMVECDRLVSIFMRGSRY